METGREPGHPSTSFLNPARDDAVPRQHGARHGIIFPNTREMVAKPLRAGPSAVCHARRGAAPTRVDTDAPWNSIVSSHCSTWTSHPCWRSTPRGNRWPADCSSYHPSRKQLFRRGSRSVPPARTSPAPRRGKKWTRRGPRTGRRCISCSSPLLGRRPRQTRGHTGNRCISCSHQGRGRGRPLCRGRSDRSRRSRTACGARLRARPRPEGNRRFGGCRPRCSNSH